ncbi:hybrid sensor histidine kinase/response regulator [Rhodoferax sp. BAB1]|uniref:ATP-binding response regulator n=1 Tax=Rhodoferax sp. BAB1 TaxID=2741720 RepID=UPI001576006C|nr:hybrid sensor histidine kinase/response regulator [Rhodoferax sp. BAB1]QKO21097.1 hybrid sensor histidine kinase/response regulator [Rhodoferax sp. BAB1]
MNVLDPRSIIVISAVLAVVTLVILISLRRNASHTIKGIGEWVAAFTAGILVAVLLVSRESLHPVVGHALANTILVMMVMLFDLGLRKFYGKTISFTPLLLVGAALLAALAFIWFAGYSARVRLTLVTSALLCVFAFAFWNLLRNASGTFGERITEFALVVPVLGIGLRLLTAGDIGPNPPLFQATPVQSFYLASLGAGILSAGVGFILMVNERTRAELEKLARSLEQTTQELRQQNEAKSKFLAYAGHDIRQPLQTIHLLLAGLMESGLDARQGQTARSIEAAVHALTELLDALLDLSKLDAGAIKPSLRPLDVDGLLARLVQEFTPQACAQGLRLRLRLPAAETTVLTDAQLLASVLRNLIANAIKYTRAGGVLVSARRMGQGLKVQVWDTGIGIPEAHLAHVFEEYYQVDNPQRDRRRGLGLGLSIVSRISALLHLRLACRSRVGRGTVMEIVLPLASGRPAVPAPAQAEPAGLHLSGASIVLVEDTADVAAALVAWLQAQGAQVRHHRTAEDALADPGTLAADIVLSDQRLPGPLSGLDFLNRLRARAPREVQGALLTGDTSSQFIEQVAASGWPILFKPVHPRELKALLKWLRESAAQPDLA